MPEAIDDRIRRAREAWELGRRLNTPTPLRPVPVSRLAPRKGSW